MSNVNSGSYQSSSAYVPSVVHLCQHDCCNTLSWSHGSWTGSDDVRKGIQKRRIKGSGGYKEVVQAMKPMVATALRDSGDYIGRAVASQLGLPADKIGKLGRTAGAKISRLIGSGPYGLDLSDYKIRGVS